MAATHEEKSHAVRAQAKLKQMLKEMLAESAATVERLFKLFDVDGSGLIDRDEFFEMCVSFGGRQGLDVTREVSDAILNEFDVDGSGEISYDEWIVFVIRDALARAGHHPVAPHSDSEPESDDSSAELFDI